MNANLRLPISPFIRWVLTCLLFGVLAAGWQETQGSPAEIAPAPTPMAVQIAPTVVLAHSVATATPIPRATPPPGWATAADPFFKTNFDMRFWLGDKDNNVYDGYFWNLDRSNWVPGMVSNRTWFLPSPQYTIGNAVFYASGLMQATAMVRGMSLEGYQGGVSMLSPGDIGRTVWLRRQGHDWEGPFLVVDCARRADIWPVIYYRGEVVEVDFERAIVWGMVAPMTYKRLSYRLDGLEVWKGAARPPEEMVGPPVDLRGWWIPRVEFSDRWEWAPVFEPGGTWREPLRYVENGLWMSTPVYATDEATVTPAPIIHLADAECEASMRWCGEARHKLIEWGIIGG